MVKASVYALLMALPFASAALCENGGMTTLTKPVEFQYREANGNILKMSLAPGAPVHIVSLDSTKVMLLGHSEFQGQRLAMLGELDLSNIKSLKCAE